MEQDLGEKPLAQGAPNRKFLLVWIACVLVSGVVGFATGMFIDILKPKVVNQPKNGPVQFRNQKLGFGFDYPQEWGVAEETISDIGASNNTEYDQSGKYYLLNFTKNKNVDAKGASEDFHRPIGGGVYKGDKQKGAGVEFKVVIPIHPGCVEGESGSGSDYYAGQIYFNMPGREISGVVLELPILSQSEIKKVEDESGYKPLDCLGLSANELKKQEAISKNLKVRIDNLEVDDESKNLLEIFKKIGNSARVTNN